MFPWLQQRAQHLRNVLDVCGVVEIERMLEYIMSREYLCSEFCIQWPYVAFKRDLTYSPAVTISYSSGMSGETQLGMGYIGEHTKLSRAFNLTAMPHLQLDIIICAKEQGDWVSLDTATVDGTMYGRLEDVIYALSVIIHRLYEWMWAYWSSVQTDRPGCRNVRSQRTQSKTSGIDLLDYQSSWDGRRVYPLLFCVQNLQSLDFRFLP